MSSIANNGSFHRDENGTIHHHLEPKVSISGITPPIPHTLILRFWRGYVPRPRSEKLANNGRTPKNNVLIYFSVFAFLQKRGDEKCFLFPLQLLDQHAVWLEDLFGLSNSYDAYIH